MTRLPTPGSDDGTWGDILNAFLEVAHNTDGSLADNAVTSETISDGAVTVDKLSAPAPASGQVLGFDGTDLEWTTPTDVGDVPDADATTKGVLRLTGDLGGTAASPAIAKLKGVSLPASGPTTSGQVLTSTSASATAWSAPASPSLASAADVAINTPTDAQVLRYSASLAKWQNATLSLGGVASGVLTVASSECPQAVKDVCDYVCTGTDDQTVINQALQRASRPNDGFGGEGYIGVHLVGPTFYVGNNGTTSITMYPSTHLFGSGPGTLIWPKWPTNVDRGAIELLNTSTAHVRVSNLSIGRPTAVTFNGHGIKFNGVGVGDGYEIKSGNDPYATVDHVNVFFAGKKGIYMTGSSGGMREAQISHCIAWNATEEGIMVEGSSDCQISDCRANGGGSAPRFSLSGGNTKIANCKAYYSGGSSNLNADGFQVSSSRCEVVGCSAQDNGRYGFNISSSSANISACTADSNSRLQSDGGGFLISSACSAQGLVAFDRGQTPGSPQLNGIVFSSTPQVNLTAYVDVPSGTNHVTGSVNANSYVRVVRKSTTLYTVN